MQVSTVTAALWETFAANAQLLSTGVERVADEAAAAELLAELPSKVFTNGVTARWPRLTERADLLRANEIAATSRAEGAAEVVAAGAFAVAETGSVAVCAGQRDRAACLLATRLWLVVAAADIVPTLDAALARVATLARAGEHYLTFMSGPSRTADIERTLTIGAHGPRALTIVIVEA